MKLAHGKNVARVVADHRLDFETVNQIKSKLISMGFGG